MFQTDAVEKINTHILRSITFLRKSCRLWDNVEKYDTARQTKDDNIILRMRFAGRITTERLQTIRIYITRIAFLWLRPLGYANAPQCYAALTTAVFLFLSRKAVLFYERWRKTATQSEEKKTEADYEHSSCRKFQPTLILLDYILWKP